MYQFICSNNHTSYSAAEEPTDKTCPTCGEPTHLVNDESQDRVTKPVTEES